MCIRDRLLQQAFYETGQLQKYDILKENPNEEGYIIKLSYESGLKIQVQCVVEDYRLEVLEYHYDFVDERLLDDIAQNLCPRAKKAYELEKQVEIVQKENKEAVEYDGISKYEQSEPTV